LPFPRNHEVAEDLVADFDGGARKPFGIGEKHFVDPVVFGEGEFLAPATIHRKAIISSSSPIDIAFMVIGNILEANSW
jgi:hypothetical protein